MISFYLWKETNMKKPPKKNLPPGVEYQQPHPIVQFFLDLKYLFSKGMFFYQVAFFCMAVFGCFRPPAFAFHLLDFSIKNAQTRNVLKAVTQNGKLILLTAFLGLILIYLYAMIAFFYLKINYLNGSQAECYSLFSCVLTNIQYGLRSGGGVGDVLNISLLQNNPSLYFAMFFYNLSFFIIIIIIFLNIVFGIIIDTFGELRDARSKIEEDQQNFCFICGNEISTLEKKVAMKYHIKNEHNLWHYLYFFIYLKLKKKDEYTAIEEYVSKRLEKKKSDFFPFLKAISLEDDDEDDDDVEKKVDNLEKKIDARFAGLFKALKIQT